MTGLLSPSLLELSDHFYKPSSKKPLPISIASTIDFPRLPNSLAYWSELTAEGQTSKLSDESRTLRIKYSTVWLSKPPLGEEPISPTLISKLQRSCEEMLDYGRLLQSDLGGDTCPKIPCP